jgi:uncharacterized protein (DUF2147 family)
MLRTNVGLLIAGCAAIVIGVTGGWSLAVRMPTAQQPIEATSPQAPDPSPAAPVIADEAAQARPSPATPALRERNASASGPAGVWIDHTGRGAVEITECAGALCGRIVWLKDAGHKSVCGTQVIGNAKRTTSGTWDGGWIYDPDKKARYSVELKLVGADKLRVVGYMGSKLFSETFVWKRPSSDITRCDAPAVTATPSPAPAGEIKPDLTKAAPSSTDQPSEVPSTSKGPKSKSARMSDIEKIAREMMKGKSGGKGCTVKMPHVGNVSIPCPG